MRAPRCRVMLVAEGPSELGTLAAPTGFDRGQEGFLQPLLRRLVDGRMDLDFVGQVIKRLPKQPLAASGRAGLARRAGTALALARFEGCQALVFVHDVDRTSGHKRSERERIKRIRELRALVEQGFAEARTRDPARASVTAITATPCRMLEAWALADVGVLRERADPEARIEAIPERPEKCWGDKKDPKSGHPKRRLERALGRAPRAEDFAEIAERTDLQALRSACPDSFAPFADAVDAAIGECRGRSPELETP